jgi:RNA polymerase sigma factor (TIGR02999 family)
MNADSSTHGPSPTHPHADLTAVLAAASAGNQAALAGVLPLVYDELRALADEHLRRERAGHTLQATALVHEAYLRLVGQHQADWRNRAHFLALAAQAMRRILVDHARARAREKRGGGAPVISLDESAAEVGAPGASDASGADLLAVDDALARLARLDPDAARVVEMRFFAGLDGAQAAAVMGVSERTVWRHWRFARAWLYRELGGAGAPARGEDGQ